MDLLKVLLKNAKIISSTSPFNGQSKDILIENGIISRIADSIIMDEAKAISFDNLHVSEGWHDGFSNFCDPGFEFKETLETGSAAAAAGGFTCVLVTPNTYPVVHSKSQVEYLVQSRSGLPVTIYPIGAVTRKTEGKELTEMYDMYKSGAVAFSDGTRPIQSSGMVLNALQYLLAIDSTLIQIPDDTSISRSGLMNEGIISTKLGLPGKPAIAEHILISRDIALAAYTNSKIHFTGISTEESLKLILNAKATGLKVSCSVTPYHLFFCDEDIQLYDANFKVNPPLRPKSDMLALKEAARNGEIDFIASHHEPQDWDNKTCEFEYAQPGMAALESVFGVAMHCGISIERFVQMQTMNICQIFNLPKSMISEGSPAQLTLFNPEIRCTMESNNAYAKSKNNALNGKELIGKSLGIFNHNKLFLNKLL